MHSPSENTFQAQSRTKTKLQVHKKSFSFDFITNTIESEFRVHDRFLWNELKVFNPFTSHIGRSFDFKILNYFPLNPISTNNLSFEISVKEHHLTEIKIAFIQKTRSSGFIPLV